MNDVDLQLSHFASKVILNSHKEAQETQRVIANLSLGV